MTFPTALILCSQAGSLLKANQAMASLTGKPIEEILGRFIGELGVLESENSWQALVHERKTFPNGNKEIRVRHASGKTSTCSCVLVELLFEGQTCLLANLVDITEQMAAEESLRNAEAESRAARRTLENLFDAIPDVIGLQDRDHHVLRYNAAGYRFLRIKPEKLDGRRCFEFIGRTEPCKVCATTEAIKTGKPARFRKHVPEFDAWLDAHAYPILDESGRVTMVIEHLRDITDHKRSIEERERLFNTSLDMLCVAGFDGRFKQLNPAWTKTLGWTIDELLQSPWLDFVHPEEHEITGQVAEKLMAGQALHGFENHYRCKDGTYRLLSWNSFPIPEEQSIFAVVRDITEKRRMQEQLQHVEKMEALGQLAGGVAHDFNNQLVGILGFAELLSRRSDDPDQQRLAKGIIGAANRCAELTRSLLAFARKGKYRTEAVDVHAIIDEVALLLEHTIDKRIIVRKDLQAKNAVVMGDPTQLQNAILNLALNARDAMPSGGKMVFATTTTELEDRIDDPCLEKLQAGTYLCMTVSDTGVGMDEDTCQRVFEPFFTTKPPGLGVGLGLPAVYGCVRSHDGCITADSQLGEGTTFRICLPLAESRPVGRPVQPGGGVPETHRTRARILIVDDEPAVRSVASELLRQEGHEVREFATGPEAVAYYKGAFRETDLVLVDMIMPEMSGRDLLQALRQINPQVRALLVSGFSINDEAQKTLDEGACGFVQKPFELKILIEAVNAALKR